jgi:hypothetical protein
MRRDLVVTEEVCQVLMVVGQGSLDVSPIWLETQAGAAKFDQYRKSSTLAYRHFDSPRPVDFGPIH